MRKSYFFIVAIIGSILFSGCEKEKLDLSKGFIKYFGGSEFEDANDLQQTSDGGYIIIGNSSSYGYGGTDIYLVKTDNAGNRTWQKSFGDSLNDEGHAVKQTTDGGYIIVGSFRNTAGLDSGKTDVYIIKTGSAGDVQWSRLY